MAQAYFVGMTASCWPFRASASGILLYDLSPLSAEGRGRGGGTYGTVGDTGIGRNLIHTPGSPLVWV